jgi:hypothetical protein
MAHTFRVQSGRQTSANNPYQSFISTDVNDTVMVLLIKTVGSTDRAGGAPTYQRVGTPASSAQSFIQANTTQKAAASPEASAELWYLLNPMTAEAGQVIFTIPNTGAATLYFTLVALQAQAGMISEFDGANGSNGTSANPTTGAVVTTGIGGSAGVAVVVSGATDFDPATPSHTGFGTGTGTPLGTFDDGAHGGGQQYAIQTSPGSITMSWTFATSDDWGAVAAYFKEVVDPSNVPENYKFVKAPDGISTSERIR